MPLTDSQAILDEAAHRRHRTKTWLICIDACVGLLLAVLAYTVLVDAHRSFARQATDVAEGLAAVAQLNIQSEIDRVDAVMRATAAELERLMSAPTPAADDTINDVLAARFKLLSGIEAMRLTDADGRVRWGTGLPPGSPVDVSDRDYFQEAKARDAPATVIAGPLTSRISGNWIIAFMRPVQLKGRFAGVVYVSMDAGHFRRMFERYDLGPLDSVALRRDDRRLVARFAPGSPVQGEVGDVNISAPLRAALQAHPRSGSVVSRVAVDGQERTTAYRALDSWPFVVFTGVANDRFFEPWRRQVWTVTSLAALAWLLVTAALWMLCRASRREDDAMQALANQGRRIQALLHTAGDGIHIMDATGHLVEMSDSFADMLRSSRARLMGRHISSWDVNQDKATIDAWLARIKPGDRQRVDVQHRRDDGQVIDVEIQLSITEIAAQLFVFASARDVTNERRLMREQQAMLDSDLVGMAKIESRVITWRNRAAERMLGYGEGELQGQPVRIVYWDDAEYDRVGLEGYDALRQHRRYRSQVRMRRKSGELVWIDFSAVPLSDTEVFAMLVDITATRAAHESLVHAAFHDALTQLPNRVLLHDRIGQARAAARREDAAVAVCYLDLDGFKAVNDTHGHDAGDHLLKTIADRLVRAVRACDTVSRMGGDEFVLVLAPVSDGEWQPILRRVIDTIGDPVALPAGPEVRVGVTAGVAIVTADDDAGAQQWIERADQAMLHGKRHGKGQVSVDPASPVGSAGPNGRETRAESGGRWPSRA